jgi:hypothetical protein
MVRMTSVNREAGRKFSMLRRNPFVAPDDLSSYHSWLKESFALAKHANISLGFGSVKSGYFQFGVIECLENLRNRGSGCKSAGGKELYEWRQGVHDTVGERIFGRTDILVCLRRTFLSAESTGQECPVETGRNACPTSTAPRGMNPEARIILGFLRKNNRVLLAWPWHVYYSGNA